MTKLWAVLISISLILLTGCTISDSDIKAKKNDLSVLAKQYVKEKYGMNEPKIIKVDLNYSVSGPIPDLVQTVPSSGVVYIENGSDSFQVVVSTGWSKWTKKFKNIVADNYQAEEIKNSIKQEVIEKYKVTDEYSVQQLEVSSVIGDEGKMGYDWIYRYIFNPEYNGDMSYFSLKQKFDGNIETFLKDNDYSIKLGIVFKGNEKDKGKYTAESKKLLEEITNKFGKGDSKISVKVYKEDEYKNYSILKLLDENLNEKYIDPSVYTYSSITTETNSRTKKVEVHENSYNFVEVANCISVASNIEDLEFTSKNDLKYAVKQIEDSDVFNTADFKSLDKFADKEYQYGFLNKSIYHISYLKKEYNGQTVIWSDGVSLKINKSIVPKDVEDLFLIYKNKDGTVRTDSQSYLVSSQDSFIGFAAIDSDFIIGYREKK